MSDIVIRNMEMPREGSVTLTITSKGEIILGGCIFTHNFGKEVKAIELPPHGRLIDADMIEFEYDPHFGGRIIATSDAIANTPTILEASKED